MIPTAKLNRIQILRMNAAVAVVIYHAFLYAEKLGSQIGWFAWARFGYLGVDVFFVISGFIIFYTAELREMSAGEFAVRRLERLVPIYWAFTISLFLIGLLVPELFASGGAGEWMTAKNLLASLAFVSVPMGQKTIVFVGWTIEYEMFFYLLVTVFLALSRRSWLKLAWTFVVLVALRPLIGNLSPLANFLTNPLLVEFVLGMLVADFVFRRKLTLLLPTAVAVGLSQFVPGDAWRVAVGALPAAIVVLLLSLRDQARPLEKRGLPGVAMFLGDASYSIYLVQVLTIPATFKAMTTLAPALSLVAVALLSILVTVAAACIVFALFERPLMAYFQGRRRARSADHKSCVLSEHSN